MGEEMKGGRNRRRIKTEEMAKVVAAVWRTELIQFLASLAISHQDDFKKRMNRIMVTWWNGGFVWLISYQATPLPNGCFP